MRSAEEISALSAMDPELHQDGSVVSPLWNKDTDVYEVRAVLAQIAKAQEEAGDLSTKENDQQIRTRDEASIAVRVHRPPGLAPDKGGRPGMLMLHGGGYSIGDLNTGARLGRIFAELGGVAVNVDFRLAPEHPFPGPVEDAYDALEWVSENVECLGIDPAKGFIVAGESSGANMALAVTYLWATQKNDLPLKITGIYASANSGATAETVPEKYKSSFTSMEQNADAPVMSIEALERIRELYRPDTRSPLAYPISIPNPSIMPRTYFQACGLDPTRDCTLVMEKV